MKIIFGLGNPTIKYEQTRHNVGFWTIDNWARAHEASFVMKPKFKAELAELTIGDEKIIVAKPQTYYNLVGESLQSLRQFYQVAADDCLVICDDLSLPLGRLRTRHGGSDAGNNGIKSINQHGGDQTNRLRIGINTPVRPSMSDADFVLAPFSSDEQLLLSKLLPTMTHWINDFVAGQHLPTTYSLPE